MKAYSYLFHGYRGWSWDMDKTMLLLYLPVYGPLEAFFIVFSVRKLDAGLSCERLVSKGLIISSFLFGLMHATNYLFHPDVALVLSGYVLGNIVPAFLVGLVFKKSRSILGSSLFWTALNFF